MKKITFLFVMAIALTATSYAQLGATDSNFSSQVSVDGSVNSSLTTPDGKIIIVGDFANVNGTTSNRIARLYPDGSKDTTFAIDLAAGVTTLAATGTLGRAVQLQSNGKIIVAGEFTTVNGNAVPRSIIRLNPNGTLDTTFNSGGAGADGTISTIAIDANDRIIIGGSFLNYNGTSRNRIARLNADGTLDTSFVVGSGTSSGVNAIAFQPSDSKIIIAGNFTSYNGIARSRIARLNTDGSLDAGFTPGEVNAAVRTIAIQPDGRIIYGGDFTSYGGDVNKKYLVRVTTDGALDTIYSSYGFNGSVKSIALDQNGKLYVGGAFSNYNSATTNNIARLYTDGSLDTHFDTTGGNAAVESAIIQNDGKMLVGGAFTSFNGIPQNGLVRVSGYYTSQLNTAYCGDALPNLNTTMNADWVDSLTRYHFKITKVDMNTNLPLAAPIVVAREASNISLANVHGVTFNSKYKIEVGIQMNYEKKPYYGAACYVTTPNPVATIGTQCGTTVTAMDEYVYATYVQYVPGYRFRITNTNNNTVQIYDSVLNKFSFNQLANQSYGTTYLVEVALQNTDGTYLPYGVGCTITSPAVPTTAIESSQCESTVMNNKQYVYANSVSGATAYRFLVSRGETPTYTSSVERPLNAFNLSMFSGLAAGTTYDVQVAVKVDGVWGSYGSTCFITTPGGNTKITNDVSADFTAVAYPNPFTSDFKLNVSTVADNAIQIKVYDMLGNQIENKNVEGNALENLMVGGNYTSGVYHVIVSQGGNTQTLRIIKR